MKKITKKQYKTRKLMLQLVLSQVYEDINNWHNNLENDIAEDKNYLYDDEYKINKEMRNLEHEYETRNWTTADWTSYNIAINNID